MFVPTAEKDVLFGNGKTEKPYHSKAPLKNNGKQFFTHKFPNRIVL